MGQVRYRLFLGNKVYSSWSLRAWLLLVPFDIAFEQEVVPLYTDDFESFRNRCRPVRQVPTLLAMQGPKRIVVWDSLAIAEFLHERHPEAGIWPADPIERAAARSLCAEMHAGFKALRSTMPMNLRRSYANFAPDQDAREDIARMLELWRWQDPTGAAMALIFLVRGSRRPTPSSRRSPLDSGLTRSSWTRHRAVARMRS